jgi:hypothetical protein
MDVAGGKMRYVQASTNGSDEISTDESEIDQRSE